MKNIEITVVKKVAYADGMPTIVCGNNDYTLSFVFDDEWSGELHKVARFSFVKNGLKGFIDMPIENNTCKVPVLLGIGLVRVGVYAGDLRTTTGAKIKCTKSILCDDAEEMVEPFENLYEKLKNEMPTVINTAVVDYMNSIIMGTEDFEGRDEQITDDVVPSMALFYDVFVGHEERLCAIEGEHFQALQLLGGAD